MGRVTVHAIGFTSVGGILDPVAQSVECDS